jgi:hypothetical protein
MVERPKRVPTSPPKAYDLGFKNGASHGFDECRQQALDWLQAKYITDPGRPDRDSKEAQYLLDLVRQLQLHLSEVKLKRIP